MKRIVIAATVAAVALFALRRFGPAIGERAMAKCQEMMTGGRGAGAELPDPDGAEKGLPTPALA